MSNLNAAQRSDLALKLTDTYKAIAKQNQVARKGEQAGATCQNSDNLTPIDTKKEVAKAAGVSHSLNNCH